MTKAATPGTNSEAGVRRACAAAGLRADLVHWNAGFDRVRGHGAFVLPRTEPPPRGAHGPHRGLRTLAPR